MPEKRMLDVQILNTTVQLPFEVNTPEEERATRRELLKNESMVDLLEQRIEAMKNPLWGHQDCVKNAFISLSKQIDIQALRSDIDFFQKVIKDTNSKSTSIRDWIKKNQSIFDAVMLLATLEDGEKNEQD